MPAEIVIRFVRKQVVVSSAVTKYYLYTEVYEPDTTPEDIDACLVFTTGSEQIARIASVADLTNIEETFAEFTTFHSASLALVIQPINPATDELEILSIPTLWNEIGYSLKSYPIVSEDVAGSNTIVIADALPAFATGISYRIVRNGNPLTEYADGEARRTYTGTPDIEYRITRHYDLFDTLLAAQNMLTSLRGQAQGLASAWNEDLYSGDDTERFQ